MSLLELRDASFAYGKGQPVVEGVSVSLDAGDTVGLVGESGAGKSTILALMLGLSSPTAGELLFDGKPLERRDAATMRLFRSSVQTVFQDPYSSLDPRQRIDRIVAEPLRSLRIASGDTARQRVREALDSVGLPADVLERYPHEFSGGQRQRIAIARAIVCRPRVLLADEPVSALDVTTRIQVIDVLRRLRSETGLALLMVSHDLSTVAALCERSIVLKDGRVVEEGATRSVLSSPSTDYARQLVAAVPRLP
ncbi:peptide/nickel transport system ATP-binding protein [Paramicrobacterium humi]|uniref:Peptide/nickel transport system ATP-binding protein n=1 Tax=Paramicrobacterium humi TaxID=640635 RepID=A0A1H4JWI8_9MICO|nr:ABC transporter ATP-binding protein [Microbacterium humi]SEB50659.1 peptide/nickel transport system ATP-binding protein [Microbacterium humi]